MSNRRSYQQQQTTPSSTTSNNTHNTSHDDKSHNRKGGGGGRHRAVTKRSVETQTDENSFCLCYIPEYKAKLDEEQEMDPRIKLMLDQLHVLSEGRITCVIRNFEKKPKLSAKQRWKASGNALRAVGKFKGRKKNLMDLTMTNPDEEELRSGFYAQDVEHHFVQEEDEDFFTSIIKEQKRRWSLKKFSFRKKRRSSQRQDERFDDRLLPSESNGEFDAQKGSGKMLEQVKSQENLIIESFINECMRESMRSHNKNAPKNKAASENGEIARHANTGEGRHHEDTDDDESSFVIAKETKHVTRSVTLLNGYNSENRPATTKTRGEESEPSREPARRGNSDAQVHEANRKKMRRPKSNLSDISDITERQKRASQRISSYYEKSANTSTENVAALRRIANRAKKQSISSRHDTDDSELGSTLSAFALVPGTDLQRKLSQHGINDKASMDTIKQKTSSQQRIDRNKYPPSSTSTRNNPKQVKRRSFHSVDNIYASSSMNSNNKNNRNSVHMITQNLQNSLSADDIDETGHLFKPLKDSDNNRDTSGGGGANDKQHNLNFMITSTPREVEDVPEEHEEEEGMATYV